MFNLQRRYQDGEMKHWLHGNSWYDHCRRERVCYPIPLNWLMAWMRMIWFFLHRSNITWIEKQESRMFDSLIEKRREEIHARLRDLEKQFLAIAKGMTPDCTKSIEEIEYELRRAIDKAPIR